MRQTAAARTMLSVTYDRNLAPRMTLLVDLCEQRVGFGAPQDTLRRNFLIKRITSDGGGDESSAWVYPAMHRDGRGVHISRVAHWLRSTG